MSFTTSVIAFSIITILMIVFFVALNKAMNKDWEREEREQREQYYDRILNKNKKTDA